MRKRSLFTILAAYVLFQEISLAKLLVAGSWEDVVVGGPHSVVERVDGEVRWRATSSSGSGGESCDLIIETEAGTFHWMAGQNFGTCWVRRFHKDGDPVFLVYQPIFDFTSNHRLLESPHLNEPGVWLVTNTLEGYRRRPVVTNPVSLVARNPVGTLLMGFNGLERLHRESMRGEVATLA